MDNGRSMTSRLMGKSDGMGRLRYILMMMSVSAAMLLSSEVGAATRCEVLTIHASNVGRGTDAKLSRFAALFVQKPFSAFDTFELMETQEIGLEMGIPAALKLPERIGGTLRLNKIENGKFDLSLSLSRDGKPPVRINGIAAAQSPILAAGMKSKNGVWIFGVACDHDASGMSY